MERRADGFELRQKAEEKRDGVLRGALIYRALLRAAEREAVLVVREAAEDVSHPNLARVLEPGMSFVLVEDLRGTRTVAELVATNGPAHWREAVELGRHLARALAALHGAGFVHGDLGLSSVHVNARWEPLLARVLERGEPAGGGGAGALSSSKGDGPPCSRAKNVRELGAVLYALLTGTRPAEEPVAPRLIVSEVPEKLERLVLDLLASRLSGAAQAAILLDGFAV